MSFSVSLEGTPSAMKGLFKSRPGMGKLTSWGEESDVDDPVVLEDRPRLPKSSDLDNGTGEYLSSEDGDSKESSTFEAIEPRDEVPRGNVALTHAVKTYQSKGKEGKGQTFLVLNYPKNI